MSLPRYPKYKDSGAEWLGELPSDWDVRRIRFLFQIKKRIAGAEGYDVLSITQQGIKIKDLESNDGQLSLDYSKYQFVEIGDFAMNHMDLLTGYVDISKFSGVTSPDYRVFSLKSASTCDSHYFLYIFQIGYKQKIFYPFGQGSSQLGRWRLPTEQFQDFVLPLPTHQEQIAIADFLNREIAKIDSLVDDQRRLVELLKEKRQAAISNAVTKGLDPDAPMKDSGIEWIGDVPQHWQVLRVKHVSIFTTSGPRGWSERISEFGSIFVQSGDLGDALRIGFDNCKRVQVEEGAEASRTLLANGDSVVCITGAKTGNVAVCEGLKEPAYVNQHLCLIRPNEAILPQFLGLMLKSGIGQTHFEVSQYGLKQGLSLENVREAPVLLPSLSEQQKILDFLDLDAMRFSVLSKNAATAIDLLQERRTALISAAVTGKIDVRGLATEDAA